jgi:hypothetical protein
MMCQTGWIRELRRYCCVAVPLFVFSLAIDASLSAAISFSGTGPGADGGTVSAQAEFTIAGNQLTIVLTNTSAPLHTANNGQVLTGLIWDFSPNLLGTLSLFPDAASNPVHTNATDNTWVVQSAGGGSTTYAIDNSVALGGTWTNALTSASLGDYGYATTGANGLFAAGQIVGPSPGSANYGLVSDATYLSSPITAPNGYGPQSLPLVQNSITVRFQYNGADPFLESNIVGVRFLVGTAGDNFPGEQPPSNIPPVIPEPMSLALWAGLFGAAVGWRRIRRA